MLLLAAVAGCGEPSEPLPPAPIAVPADLPGTAALPPIGIWQDEDPYLRGYVALAEAVADLSTNIRVLHTGAHPDDEMSDLVAYLARGRHFRTAYLSATRGEGGQNGIGPETGEALGVIRTEELLAARRIDGAEQYFLSVPDFGFSKTAEETLKIWGEEKTLRELVHFIRWYRPQVIVSVFSGTPLDGHGHHQAMGILTRKAFDAAADPAFKDDLPPWNTQLLFQSLWRDPGEEKLPGQRFTIDTGQYDALLGKTYHQIAMEGRSQHRSQDMGAPQDPGPHPIILRLWAGTIPPLCATPDPVSRRIGPYGPDDPFFTVKEALNTMHDMYAYASALEQRSHRVLFGPTPIAEPPEEQRFAFQIVEAENAVLAAFLRGNHRDLFQLLSHGQAASLAGKEVLFENINRLPSPGWATGRLPPDFESIQAAQFEFQSAAQRFERALHLASGLHFEVRCDQKYLTPGQSGSLTVRIIGQGPAVQLQALTFDHADTWQFKEIERSQPSIFESDNVTAVAPTAPGSTGSPARASTAPVPPTAPAPATLLCSGRTVTLKYSFTVPDNTPYTQPTYKPMAWAEASQYGNHHQATMDLPPIVANLTYSLPTTASDTLATKVEVATSAQYRWTDPRFGERREMVKIVPPISVEITPKIVAVMGKRGEVLQAPPRLEVTRLVERSITFTAEVHALIHDNNQTLLNEIPPINLDSTNRVFETSLWKENGPSLPEGHTIEAFARWADLSSFPQNLREVRDTLTRIEYPHIRPHNLLRPAQIPTVHFYHTQPVQCRAAYIAAPGADDEMIDALRQLGAEVIVLDDGGLAKAALAQFHTIFVGTRAYELRPDLTTQNQRLLDYVKNGGTLVVLYQKYPFAKQNCAPAPFQFSEPHDRVTEEDAEVTILKPDHPLFTTPNKITQDDFGAPKDAPQGDSRNWHQDRGLYFFAEQNRDPGYTALLSCHDANEPAKTGGLLDYKLEKGHWVYCAYALHLQIPQAVPGAWRILANLASYGKTAKEAKAPSPDAPQP